MANSLEEVLPKCDFLYMTRVQRERLGAATSLEGKGIRITAELLRKSARPSLKVRHVKDSFSSWRQRWVSEGCKQWTSSGVCAGIASPAQSGGTGHLRRRDTPRALFSTGLQRSVRAYGSPGTSHGRPFFPLLFGLGLNGPLPKSRAPHSAVFWGQRPCSIAFRFASSFALGHCHLLQDCIAQQEVESLLLVFRKTHRRFRPPLSISRLQRVSDRTLFRVSV